MKIVKKLGEGDTQLYIADIYALWDLDKSLTELYKLNLSATDSLYCLAGFTIRVLGLVSKIGGGW